NKADVQQRKQLSPEIIDYVKKGKDIPLNNFNVSHLARKISPYEVRGTGLIVSCFRQLMLFDKLRESKYAQADNMVNPLTLVKIGNDEFRPTPVDLDQWREVFECYDDETEVLTNNGFKYFKDVISYESVLDGTNGHQYYNAYVNPESNTTIACFNPETEMIEYHEPTKASVYDYSGEMIRFKNDKMDIKV